MSNEITAKVKAVFTEKFGKEPLLIASPGRINLIGEHTDYNEGFVFPAGIDKVIVSAFSESDDGRTHIYSIDMEEEISIDLSEIEKQKSGDWKNYIFGVISELRKKEAELKNFNLVFGGNIPNGAGLSSSAALENSFTFGLNELFQLGLDKQEMVYVSMYAEHHFAGVQCGIMDQFASMNGRKDHAIFLDCRDLSNELVPIRLKDHQLIIINTNVKHSLAGSEYNKRRSECNEGVKILQKKYPGIWSLRDADLTQLESVKDRMNDTVYRRSRYVIEENTRVLRAKEAIRNNNWQEFGKLLYASHEGLSKLYEVSCESLDYPVEIARSEPAVLGSRLMGGGFGGCTISLVENNGVPAYIEKVQKAYKDKFNREATVIPIRIADGTHRVIS